MTQRQSFVALGANLARDSAGAGGTLRMAVSFLQAVDFVLLRCSPFYLTPAVPAGAGPPFVNAVAAFSSGDLSPVAVLDRLHAVEDRLGRRRGKRWGARVIDLDLLALEDLVWPDMATQRAWIELSAARQAQEAPEGLVLPHPRLQDRGFVLVPLCDIAPGWRHPVLGRTAAELRDRLDPRDLAAIRPETG